MTDEYAAPEGAQPSYHDWLWLQATGMMPLVKGGQGRHSDTILRDAAPGVHVAEGGVRLAALGIGLFVLALLLRGIVAWSQDFAGVTP